MAERELPPGEWHPIRTAPTTGPVVEVEAWNGVEVKRAHWAHGGGEDQPRFGPAWFYQVGEDSACWFNEMHPQPTHWRAIPSAALSRHSTVTESSSSAASAGGAPVGEPTTPGEPNEHTR